MQGVWLFCPGVSQVDTGQSINIRWADEVELRNPERGPPEKLAARPPSVTPAVPPQDGCPWAEQDPLTVGRETGGGASAGGGPLGARPLVSGLRPRWRRASGQQVTWRGWASGLGARRPRGGGAGPGEGNGDRSRSSASPSSAPGATATENNGQAEPRGREPDAKPGLPRVARPPRPLLRPSCAWRSPRVHSSRPRWARVSLGGLVSQRPLFALSGWFPQMPRWRRPARPRGAS